MSDPVTAPEIRVGMLGCGAVGSAVARMLDEHGDDIERRAGVRLRITRVAVRDASASRTATLPPGAFTTDPGSVVHDPAVDVVLELIGGIEPAKGLLLAAFAAGKPVVTANKELLANAGAELFEAAGMAERDIRFEAAVAGGIPLIAPLTGSLAGERLARVLGIVNGTTNYILTQMSEHGSTFGAALADAQRLGYAESDPGADIDGSDAAAKCAILASIAFDTRVVFHDVFREGISGVTPQDIADASRLGYVVKLLAIAELEDGEVSARVHPAMIPATHPLAAVRDAYNAVVVEGGKIGQLMFYGRGAGGDPTATSVVGDLVAVARDVAFGGRAVGSPRVLDRPIRSMDHSTGQYYLNLHVEDRPGVLAEIAEAFGRNGVSIERVWQEGFGEEATLVFITHRAREGAFQAAVTELRELPSVRAVASMLRVEGEE
jgi:homoserine dehydrogenase